MKVASGHGCCLLLLGRKAQATACILAREIFCLFEGKKARKVHWDEGKSSLLNMPHCLYQRFATSSPGSSDGKASARNEGDLGSIPVLGRSPGEGNGNPLQYSCLENPTDGGAWQATVHGVTKSRTQLSELHQQKYPRYPLTQLTIQHCTYKTVIGLYFFSHK